MSRAETGRRRGGRSPRSGLWRAGSASRPSKRPSRRTGTSTARPSRCSAFPTPLTPSRRTVRHRRSRLACRTGVGLRCDRRRGRSGGIRVLSVRDRTHVVAYRELPAGIARNEQHVQRSSPALMSDDRRVTARRRHAPTGNDRPRWRDSAAVLIRGVAIWSFGSCATSSPSPRSCISVGPPPASTSSSPR